MKRDKQKIEEQLPLVNENGEVTGSAPRSVCHSGKEFLHPVVHLHIISSKGEIFLQKRPMNKIQPGKWDTAVGGHVSSGEAVETALKREAMEELRIKDFNAVLSAKYIWESDIEKEFVYCYSSMYDGPITVNKEELTDGRFWSFTEIESHIGNNIFTPNFEKEYFDIIKGMRIN